MRRAVAVVLVFLAASCSDAFPEGDGDAAVWSSDDGFEWARVCHDSLGGPGEQQMVAVTRFGDRLIAVGHERTGDRFDGRVWLSPDGESWEAVTAPALDGQDYQFVWAVAETRVGVIAGGSGIWRSDDGRNWERSIDSSLSDGDVSALVGFGSGIVAGGSSGGKAVVWTSDDGVNWTGPIHLEQNTVEAGISGLAVTDDGVLAVGVDGTNGALWVSDDGAAWQRIDTDGVFDGFGRQIPNDVATAGNSVLVTGHEASYEQIFYLGLGAETTTNAAVWVDGGVSEWSRVGQATLHSLGDQIIHGVTQWNSMWVAVGIDSADPREPVGPEAEFGTGYNVDAAVWLSQDGLTWTRVDSPSFGGNDWQDMFDVVVFDDRLIAVGGDDAGGC